MHLNFICLRTKTSRPYLVSSPFLLKKNGVTCFCACLVPGLNDQHFIGHSTNTGLLMGMINERSQS